MQDKYHIHQLHQIAGHQAHQPHQAHCQGQASAQAYHCQDIQGHHLFQAQGQVHQPHQLHPVVLQSIQGSLYLHRPHFQPQQAFKAPK